MKKEYKQLRKKLKDEFINPYTSEYRVLGALVAWVNQCGIKCNASHVEILGGIMEGTIYPYQRRDRKKILKYLKRNKK